MAYTLDQQFYTSFLPLFRLSSNETYAIIVYITWLHELNRMLTRHFWRFCFILFPMVPRGISGPANEGFFI